MFDAFEKSLWSRNVAHKYEKRNLLILVNLVAGLSIFFFGYDQGVMGGVNTTRDYVRVMNIGHFSEEENIVIVDHSLQQGGINAVYYLPGTLFGCWIGGWFGDKYGRIKTMSFGALWTIFGAALQCSAQNPTWMYCARVITGLGTGALNAITPVWATETASHTSRGAFVSLEFTLNIFGVVVAYWIEFGTSKYHDQESSFIWRFPIAFQIIPLAVLAVIVWFMPESPRWLAKVGRGEQSRFILGRLRGEDESSDGQAEAEYQDICNTVKLEAETSTQNSYFAMFFGIGSGKLHTGRRVQLVIWLQILQEWIGIAGITLYGPQIFTIAGIGPEQRLWVTGLNTITYMLATFVCVFTLDRIGRRMTLYWGAIGQGICLFAAGGLAAAAKEHPPARTGQVTGYGGGATMFVFLYTCIFGATWLTVPWLYPAEIFPLQTRARGNAWGVVGWSIGNGWCALLIPTIFKALDEKALYIFGGVNALSLVVVWALYPETNQRTLEEMNLVFASDSIWNWEAEKTYARLLEEQPGLVQAARRGTYVDPESGETRRRSSVAPSAGRKFSLAAGGDTGAMPSTGHHEKEGSVHDDSDTKGSS